MCVNEISKAIMVVIWFSCVSELFIYCNVLFKQSVVGFLAVSSATKTQSSCVQFGRATRLHRIMYLIEIAAQ